MPGRCSNRRAKVIRCFRLTSREFPPEQAHHDEITLVGNEIKLDKPRSPTCDVPFRT